MAERSMGNEITAKEAAEILKVSTTAVYDMRRRGVLRGTGNLRQAAKFRREEVCALAEAREAGDSTSLEELRTSFIQVSSLCRALERRVESLERMQGLTAAHIGSDKTEVLGLLWKIEDALKEPPMNVSAIREWARIFLGVHEELFDLVERYARHPEPWRPFLDLAQKVYQDCPCTSESQSYEVTAANAELEVARRNLRQAAWIYVSKRRGVAYARTEFPDTDPDPLMHILHNHVYYR